MTPREKDIVFFILAGIILFCLLYVGVGHYADGVPTPAD